MSRDRTREIFEKLAAKPDTRKAVGKQNDYLGWINDAKLQETKMERLNQMLDELEKGGVYMNIEHPPSMKK